MINQALSGRADTNPWGVDMMAPLRNANIALQSRMQPHMRDLYLKAYTRFPSRLLMSKRYFEARGYLESAEMEDERAGAIMDIQGRLIARTLRNALESVPYYKRTVKIDPSSITPDNATEVLQEFPYIDREDIMKNPADFISRDFRNRFLIYITTGGSTGKGLGLWKRPSEFQVNQAFIENMWGHYGYDRRSRLLRIGSDGIVPLDKHPCRVCDRRLLVSPRHLSERWLPKIVAEIDEFGPDFIHSYPSCLEVLASYLGEDGKSLRIKGIFLASEEIRKEQLDFFCEVFDAPICFHYGAGENVLLGHGCYDGENIRYHLNPLFGFAENRKDEYGDELIGTGFWNEAMPLIRYRTQDYGTITDGPVECCSCGQSWKMVHQLDGRRQYFLMTKHGTKFAALSISCGVDKFIWDHVSNFQFVQNRPGEIEIHITPRSTLTPEIEARILEAQQKRLSDWFESVILVKEAEIPLTGAGKRRLVVVNVNQDTWTTGDQAS